MDEDYQNEDPQNKNDLNEDYQNEGYRDEDCQDEDYQNDNVSEKLSNTSEVHSESEHGKIESVILDQEHENTAYQEYEDIPFGGIQMRTLPEERLIAEPALFIFEDDEWRPFQRKPFLIFSVLLLSSLIIGITALVMACLRCTPVCPDEWETFQEKCYLFSEETETWNNSREYCQRWGADLMVIDHEKEQVFLENVDVKAELWIGMRFIEEKWRWVNNKIQLYKDWKAEEPKNAKHLDHDADCVVSAPQHKYKWDNCNCQQEYQFVCEKGRHITCILQPPFSTQGNLVHV